jgi:two-component system, cell cycle sensor histidine kinase and response regulator CckA
MGRCPEKEFFMQQPSSNILLISASSETEDFFSQLIKEHLRDCTLVVVSETFNKPLALEAGKFPDGIILDASSGKEETSASLSRLKETFPGQKAPVMVLLPRGATDDLTDKMLALGADDVVRRPVDDRELSIRIRQMQRLKKAEDADRAARALMAKMQSAHQNAINAGERRYRRLVEISPDTLIICTEGKVSFINDAGKGLLGAEQAETLLNRPFLDIVHSDSRPEVEHLLKERVNDASHAPFSIIKLFGENNTLAQAEAAAVPFDDDDNKSVLLVLRDVGDRTALSERFRQSQRMEAVGQLAGGVAHDFNNILTTIRGYSDLILDALTKGDPLADDVREIKNATERAASLTRQLLAFSRRQQMAPAPLDINRVVLDIQRMLKRMIGDNIALVTDLEPDLGTVKADRSQIEQVIMNLAVNARDAMPDGGSITVRTSNVTLPADRGEMSPDLPTGIYALLEMTDTGVGMNPDVIFHIFEPFFTTKARDKGTGLGLSTVYGIVKQSGGDVSVKSEPEKGTCFRIYLPIVPDLIAAMAQVRCERGAVKGWETILLVEDDKTVRYLTKRLLERAGYKVISAGHGGEALYLAAQHKGDIHLIVTDVVMPEMGGTMLVEKLAERHSSIKAVLMSGYSDQNVVHFAEKRPGVVFLSKPFSYEELTLKVRRVLDGEET